MKTSKTIFKPYRITVFALSIITMLSFLILSTTPTSADDTIVDNVMIRVPVACTLTGTGMNSHTATINPGMSNSAIGETTLKAYCNDSNGFAIYAIGYSNQEYGNNKLLYTVNGAPDSIANSDINTGLNTTGNPSSWAMKLIADSTETYPISIQSDTEGTFANFHTVPDAYKLVAKRTTGTDLGPSALGSTLKTTYQAYITNTQKAGTYMGKVKYTMVHPNNTDAPASHPAILDTGQTVNAKLKSLAATVVNGQDTTITPTFDGGDLFEEYNAYIKSINVHLETPAPEGFTPTEKNTISSSTTSKPVYIVFDNTNDAGIMHFYTEGDQIVLPSDSSSMFYAFTEITNISGISDWDTSNATNMNNMFYEAGSFATTLSLNLSSWNTSKVTNMSYMFYNAGYSATTFNLNLSSWDTSSVIDMSSMFSGAGFSATTWSIGDISSWDTSSVTNMFYMFGNAGYSATTFNLNLSSWDTSNVTDMCNMFGGAGYSATTFNLNLSSWDTSNVTDMSYIFYEAGYSATTFNLNLSSWDTSSVTNMTNMFKGAGYSATTWSIGDLSSWDTSSVTNMFYMFENAGYSATTFTLNLSSWNTSSVENMSGMFSNAGYSATTWSIGDLSSWKTSSVTNMRNMFKGAGYSATTWSIGNISSWNTSSVTNMSQMFLDAGYNATTFNLNLSSWNTSSVENMGGMFSSAGYSATTFNLNLSSWDTSKVTSMSQMFNQAGYSATTWSVIIPTTNGNNISNTTSRIYGKRTSTYGTPPSGKSFTLAQP